MHSQLQTIHGIAAAFALAVISVAGSAAAQPQATTPSELQAICNSGDAPGDIVLRATDFGALADGVTNDIAALRAAAEALCTGSGDAQRRTLLFPAGTYRIEGTWVFGESDFRLWGVRYFGCRNVRILGCNAKIDVQGDFHKTFEGDPATYPAGEPRFAHEYELIPFFFDASSLFELRGFELDGNADAMTYDPFINAEGPDHGILTTTSSDWRIADVHVHHFGTDGLVIGTGAPADTHFVIEGVISEHNGRDALSLIQTRYGSVVDSTFRDSGDSGAHYRHADGSLTPFPGFSPSAGITLEPDCGIGTPPGCETFDQRGGHIVFERVQVLDNIGSGLSSAYSSVTEDVTVRDSTLRNRPGSNAFVLWLSDGLVEDSTISAEKGSIILAGYAPQDGIIFRRNVVSGTSQLLEAHGSQQDLLIEDNQFAASYLAEPLEALGTLLVADDLYCQDRAWRFVNNQVEVELDPFTTHLGYGVALGGLLESSGNTFVSSDPAQPLSAVYDQTQTIADQLAPSGAWYAAGLGDCVDGSGLLSYVEATSSCADPSFPMCHCEPLPAHDSVVVPPKQKTVTIASGLDRLETFVKVTVRNADLGERPGHVIRLVAENGDCPPGTIIVQPDFDRRAPGEQNTVLLRGGAKKTALVPIMVWGEFFAAGDPAAPARCALQFRVETAEACLNLDPAPSNDTVPLELNVFDRNDPAPGVVHQSFVESAPPIAVRIGLGDAAGVRPVSLRVGNTDAGETAGHVIMLDTVGGDCPPGVLADLDLDRSLAGGQSMVTVRGGAAAIGTAAVTAAAADFTSRNRRSPQRCVAELHVTGPGGDTDPTNDRTKLVIDVFDANDG